MSSSSWSRAAAKSAVWKVIGIVSLIAVSWAAGISMIQIGKITIAYHILTWILYVIHERIWNRIKWGKIERKVTDGVSHYGNQIR